MEKKLPFVAMIVLQFVIIGSSTLSKSAMTSGLSPYIFVGMEKIDLRKSVDKMKALGTIVAVLGAFVVSLYKGPSLLANPVHELFSEQSNWALGCLLYTLAYLLSSMLNILQADTPKLYPDEVTIVFFCSLFGSIQNAVASLFLVKDSSAWHLSLNLQIISVVYTAFIVSVVINPVLTWCLRKKGPVFVSMFEPLNIAIAALAGFVFLADGIYLGSVIGSGAIIVGFYAVMWGQAKTTSDMVNKDCCLESASSQVTPLLQTSHTEPLFSTETN